VRQLHLSREEYGQLPVDFDGVSSKFWRVSGV
jgi:hypothetical protein